MENEKNENNEDNSKKKKFSLVIDYSKFQNNFMNNKKIEETIEKNKNEQKNPQIQNSSHKSKNFDQFLNMSEILNENNISQSSLNENETSKNKIEMSNSKYRNKISNFDNFSMESDEQNLLLSYNELTMSYNDNTKRIKLDGKLNNKIISDAFNKTTLNSYKKKKNYVKFINKNNLELALTKTVDNNKMKDKEKTSYAKLSAKNRLFKEKYKNKFINKSEKVNLFHEVNHNLNNNNSVLTLSDISNVPSTTTTVDFITGNNSKSLSSKNIYSYQVNKMNLAPSHKNNNSIMNKNNKNNLKKISNESKYHSVNELKEIYKHNCITKRRKRSHERKKTNLMLYVNKGRPIENNQKKEKDDLIYLLDNIKTKYKNQENKFKNQQKNMKSEIEILREKLKALSVNEALYQVEIEKLKRKNSEEKNKNILTENNGLNLIKSGEPSEKKFFEKKLDAIIQKHNNNDNNNILYTFSKRMPTNKLEQLLDFFNLDKDLFSGDNFFVDNDDSFNYEKAFNEYPQLKQFIEKLVEKYKKEKEYRTRLEEKTVEIFTNDMKTINLLEKKIKKYEENTKQYKNNSSLNMSFEVGSDNITKNSCKSCKSCDKII